MLLTSSDALHRQKAINTTRRAFRRFHCRPPRACLDAVTRLGTTAVVDATSRHGLSFAGLDDELSLRACRRRLRQYNDFSTFAAAAAASLPTSRYYRRLTSCCCSQYERALAPASKSPPVTPIGHLSTARAVPSLINMPRHLSRRALMLAAIRRLRLPSFRSMTRRSADIEYLSHVEASRRYFA